MSSEQPYTQVPNALLELLPLLPDAECRIMLVVIRKTAGWQKTCDVISISQFEAASGLSHQGAINGIEAAMKRGILTREPSGKNNGFCYQIPIEQVVNLVDHLKQSTKLSSQRSRPQAVNEVDHQVVNEVDTQKKYIKKTKEKGESARKRAAPPPTLDFAHEAVVTYKRISRRKIEPAAASLLASRVTDIPLFESCLTAWIQTGYNPSNIKDMLDWYDHPERMVRKLSNGRSAPEPARPVIPATPSSIAPDARSPEETARRARELMAARKAGRS